MPYQFTAIAIVLLGSCVAIAQDDKPVKRLITEADDVIAIYRQGRGAEFPALILAAWYDAHVVWSEDQMRGGAPYRTHDVDRKTIEELFARFTRDGLFANPSLNASYYGPSANHTEILIRTAEKEVLMGSWHESHKYSRTAVVTAHGIGLLNGDNRLSVLSKQPPRYLFFRQVWSETRSALRELISCDGEVVNGDLEKRAGVITWREK